MIADFGEPAPLDVSRATVGAYVSGRWAPGTPEAITLDSAVVVPADPETLKLLPSGQELTAGIIIYTDDELRTVDEAGKFPADVVTYDGKTWQVQKVERRWQVEGLEHYKSIAILEDAT